jgi:hypothetical protein
MDYEEIVREVIKVLGDEDRYGTPDPEHIHIINDGNYQGTLIFVIPEGGYQPDRYWYVKVGYGSCSGCDTLQAIQGWEDPISEQEVDDTMMLALHIVQGLKEMGEEVV